jgi:TetR/AcrR family transcriptional regulator, regulator of cefoperazone and chloramphenicol sensitivity
MRGGCAEGEQSDRILNVSSVITEDISARGRIVASAMTLFAAVGFRSATVRAIAEAAGVSPALVVHHFAGKDGLRRECDDRVVRFVRSKRETGADVLGDATDVFGPYLARMLTEPGEAADALFDQLLDVAREAVDEGVRAGTMRASADADAQAVAVLTLGVAPFFLAHQLGRWSGGAGRTGIDRISQPLADIYERGLLTGPSKGDRS